MSSTANLDALQLVRADCIVDTDFYTSLKFQTLLPILLSVLILFYNWGYGAPPARRIEDRVRRREDRARRKRARDFAYTSFLTLTYVVFATVSKTIFDTFNCIQIGDDPIRYLARDNR